MPIPVIIGGVLLAYILLAPKSPTWQGGTTTYQNPDYQPGPNPVDVHWNDAPPPGWGD